MDQTSLKIAKSVGAALLIGIMVVACSRPELPKKAAASPPPSPQATPEPIEVQKPINVSFSTYSKDWPVNWQWIDPDEGIEATPRDVKSGVLRINIPSKKYLKGDKLSAPRYVKAIKGDFQIETRVRFAPKENYQGAGILVFKDDANYLRFERAYGGVGGGGEGIRLEAREQNEVRPMVTTGDIQTELPEIDLMIVRKGRLFIAFWRESEEDQWREAGEYEADYPDSILVGLVASNTARPIVAEFGYIKLQPADQKIR